MKPSIRFKKIFNKERFDGLSLPMRRRLLLYFLCLLCGFAAVGLLLLHLLGILNPADRQMETILRYELENAVEQMQKDMDALAAHGVKLSMELSDVTQQHLREKGMAFDELRNNTSALTALQEALYSTVAYNMQLAHCSGAFCILDTTVNDNLPEASYHCLYLKYADLYGENTLNNRICLFRGASSIARAHNINLHSSWQMELNADTFSEIEEMMQTMPDPLVRAYHLTTLYFLPDTWERARFLCLPVITADGTLIGVCGFEISDLYFQLSYESVSTEHDAIVFGLFDPEDSGYVGQISESRSGYTPSYRDTFTMTDNAPFSLLESKTASFVGKTRQTAIGATKHMIAAMLPSAQYAELVRKGQLAAMGILLAVALAALSVCLWLSKKYVMPIQEELHSLNRHHKDAQEKYEKARTKISHLATKREEEIDPDLYRLFLDHLQQLTPKEQELFRYYRAEKSTAEILELMGITKNTLKYHTKNLYGKLGVTSRKELLLYTALMDVQESDNRDK